MPHIFISYRRDDSSGYVGRLHDRLTKAFTQGVVFRDIDGIEPGADFVAVIEEAVGSCDILLAVIGKQWLTTTDARGNLRLNDPHDFVRLEISTALKRGIRVIPILVGDADVPVPAALPEDLVPLTRRNAYPISDRDFHRDVDQLIEFLRKTLHLPEPVPDLPGIEQPVAEKLAAEKPAMEKPIAEPAPVSTPAPVTPVRSESAAQPARYSYPPAPSVEDIPRRKPTLPPLQDIPVSAPRQSQQYRAGSSGGGGRWLRNLFILFILVGIGAFVVFMISRPPGNMGDPGGSNNITDSDGDGWNDNIDSCPYEYGTDQGCPVPDQPISPLSGTVLQIWYTPAWGDWQLTDACNTLSAQYGIQCQLIPVDGNTAMDQVSTAMMSGSSPDILAAWESWGDNFPDYFSVWRDKDSVQGLGVLQNAPNPEAAVHLMDQLVP